MDYEQLVKNVIAQLNNSGFDYALTGAVAVGYYTNPAITNEVDVIVRIRPPMLNVLVSIIRNIGFRCDLSYLEKVWNSKFRVATFVSDEGYRLELILTPRNILRRNAVIYGFPTFVQEPASLVINSLQLSKNADDADLKKKHMNEALSMLKNAEIDMSEVRDTAKKKRTETILDELLAKVDEG